jgi:hypothetical protein
MASAPGVINQNNLQAPMGDAVKDFSARKEGCFEKVWWRLLCIKLSTDLVSVVATIAELLNLLDRMVNEKN